VGSSVKLAQQLARQRRGLAGAGGASGTGGSDDGCGCVEWHTARGGSTSSSVIPCWQLRRAHAGVLAAQRRLLEAALRRSIVIVVVFVTTAARGSSKQLRGEGRSSRREA
jgi:hypothetical protein